MSGFRLANGGLVDRSKPVNWRFDGRQMQGLAGDTIASALIASGQMIIGRSFKYHRPRGIMSAGPEEGGGLFTLGDGNRRTPNIKGTMVELAEGMELFSQNCWPSPAFDLGAVNDLLHPFIGAGFYYKTFMGPFHNTRFWMLAERFIRQAAGMGRASDLPDPDQYDIAHDFCDILVVGAGPAGLQAAVEAAERGFDTLLVEQDSRPGGSWLATGLASDISQINELTRRLAAAGGRLSCRTTAFGLYDHLVTGLLQRHDRADGDTASPRETMHIVRPRHIILASGASERVLAFVDNDRPGVMNAAAVCAYQGRFGVAAGQHIVLAGTHDGIYAQASQLARAGLDVTLLDSRSGPSALAAGTEAAGVQIMAGRVPLRTIGRGRVAGLETAGYSREGGVVRDHRIIGAEIIASSAGFVPNIQLLSQRGVRPQWDEDICSFLAGPHDLAVSLVGSADGAFDDISLASSLERLASQLPGMAPGGRIARANQKNPGRKPVRKAGIKATGKKPARPGRAMDGLFEIRSDQLSGRAFLDPQHDVTTKDIRQAADEGYLSVEHAKRYTTLGMATDQGRNGNINGIAVLAQARGISIAETGVTAFRPPFTPVSIGALAGRATGSHFKPLRRTPIHDLHLAQNAVMTDAGLWKRAWYYPDGDEDLEAASVREAISTRQSVGICDVSTLGKIQVQGPDAASFINRIYVNNFAKLPVGKARYGVMLRDDGMVFDDGTVLRLAEDEFMITTTTAQAGPVMQFLEELAQLRWPEMRVHLTSVTDALAAVAIAGPMARAVLARLAPKMDFSPAGFPFMAVRSGRLALPDGAIDCRIARISFSGEMAFEIYVAAGYGPALWSCLADQVRAEGGLCYGLEALGIMRIEKGHVTAAELDGRVTLEDAGLGRMASTSKPFIGSVLRQRPGMMDGNRPQLVGIFPKDRRGRFAAGAILCHRDEISGFGEGWITAVAHSPVLGHWIGLGFVRGGHQRWQDKTIIIADPVRGQEIEAEIVSPHMVDPAGARMQDGAQS